MLDEPIGATWYSLGKINLGLNYRTAHSFSISLLEMGWNSEKRMNPLIIAIFAVAAFAISAWFTRQFCSPGSVVYILDQPNERSLHDRPVPRGGGVAILIAIIVCGATQALFSPNKDLTVVASGMLVVAIVSFLDDRYSVPPLLSSCGSCSCGGGHALWWIFSAKI